MTNLPKDYQTNHQRVNRLRGSARHHRCEWCGGFASNWATKHGHTGKDPHRDFVALCRSCHASYDFGKLSQEDIDLIVDLINRGFKQTNIAKLFGVSEGHITNVKNGKVRAVEVAE